MPRPVKLDLKGLQEVASSAMVQRVIRVKAEQAANAVRSMNIRVGAIEGGGEIDLPVEVQASVTDDMTVNRAQARVILAHPAGGGVQAKYGALTKAAAQSGLKVKGDKR